MENHDFIITSLQPWDIPIGSNAKDIALEISKKNRVLYINTPLDKKTYLSKENSLETNHRRDIICHKRNHIRQINSNLWVLDFPFTVWPVNSLPDGILFDIINKINNKKMFAFVKKELNKLEFKDYILFIDNDIYRSFYGKELLEPSLSIYYRRDNLFIPFWIKHTKRLEPLICLKSDLIITNSAELANAVKAYNNKTYNIGQGLDLSKYDINSIYHIPSDIRNIPHPIIGYAGWIKSERLDADLLFQIAKEKKTYSFVMVGGEDEFFKKHIIHSLPNVYFTGEKKISEIPTYISTFDICLNPQKINEVTIGNYPRKIDEYLALGKPVVATRTSTMEYVFKEHVFLASNKDEYLIEIDKAIIEIDNPIKKEKRIRFALTHSWENNVNAIYNHIKQNLSPI